MIETPLSTTVSKDNKTQLLEKHPLQNSWTFWFYKHEKATHDWEDGVKEITSFDTVEDFWAIYNHIEQPSKLHYKCDYNIFKPGIKPIWEDKRNMSGGHWVLEINRYDDSLVDEYWLNILLLMIGEGFDELGDMINGCVIQMRGKNKKISLWANDASDDKSIMIIGRRIREKLNLPSEVKMNFRVYDKIYFIMSREYYF
ncbi:unnamed protein product [Gordionus sp. m RMFG-2023]